MTSHTWVAKTLSLIESGGYLDRIADVYPVPEAIDRTLPPKQRQAILAALSGNDDRKLVEAVLKLSRFPFNDPYVSFLRNWPQELTDSPATTSRIAQHLRAPGAQRVLQAAESPKEANRQMGQKFPQWLRSQYAFVGGLNTFRTDARSPIFLDATDTELMTFANSLGCAVSKRPDFIAKSHGRFVVGEAKFIGSFGGKQDDAFAEAMDLARTAAHSAVTMAVLDGVCWLPTGNKNMQKVLRNFPGNACSALLLSSFLDSV